LRRILHVWLLIRNYTIAFLTCLTNRKGLIVISVGLFGHSGDEEVWAEGTKEMLDDSFKMSCDVMRCQVSSAADF